MSDPSQPPDQPPARPDREAAAARARALLEQNAALDVRAPELPADAPWLNAPPLFFAEQLAGRVVLLDFWTACSVHCAQVAEDLRRLAARFAGEPFAIVGCHAAKFPHELDPQTVRDAVLRLGVDHPVVLDRDFALGRAYGVQAWPTQVLVSPDGRVVGQVSGVGQGGVLELLVEQALQLFAPRTAETRGGLPRRLERRDEWPRPLRYPSGLALAPDRRSLWIADTGHHRLVQVTLAGEPLRVVGDGRPGLVDGDPGQARFRAPRGLAFHGGGLLVADTGNHVLRRVELATGRVATLLGTGRAGGRAVGGDVGAHEVPLSSPADLAALGDDVFVAMSGAHQVWRLDLAAPALGVLAGDGREGKRDGPGASASLAQPSGLAVCGAELLVADAESCSVRAIDLATASVRTVAGGSEDPDDLTHFGDEEGAGPGRRFHRPLAVAADGERAWVADAYGHRVLALDPATGDVRALAGAGEPGVGDGPGPQARFREPSALAVAGDLVLVADACNHRVAAVDARTGEVRTLPVPRVPVPPPVQEGQDGSALARTQDSAPLEPGPETRLHPPVSARLRRGSARLRVTLHLEDGEELDPELPSQYRVLPRGGLVAARSVAGSIDGPELEVPLGVEAAGRLLVQVRYYPRTPSGDRLLRSAQWDVELEVAPDGAGRVALVDAPA